MAERRSPKPQVGGSIPSWPAIYRHDSNWKETAANLVFPGCQGVTIINAQADTAGGKLDTVKIFASVLIVIGGLVGFYVYADYSLLLRVVALIACVIVAVLITLNTEKGRDIWGFFHEAQIEVRKVVWPTRQETVQTTGIVILVVLLAAALMWMLDLLLGWGIRYVIG